VLGLVLDRICSIERLLMLLYDSVKYSVY
jgi:hypothetical protein